MNKNKINTAKHIRIFDFDDTLFRVPSFTSSEATGLKPYEWFDHPRSLTPPVNVIPILNIIEQAWDEEFGINYLITKRSEDCKGQVITLLDRANCKFKEKYFLGREENKALQVMNIMDMNPQALTMTIYEDSLAEIIEYAAMLADEDSKIKIDFVFVDKSKIITIPWSAAKALCEVSEIERLRLL